MDEETITVVGRYGFAQLLQGPGSRWVGRNITVHYPPVFVFHDDQDVEQSERSGHNDAEVTGQDGRSMIAKEARPALIPARIPWRTQQYVLSYRTWRHANTEFEQ